MGSSSCPKGGTLPTRMSSRQMAGLCTKDTTSRVLDTPEPKLSDQHRVSRHGRLTENGKFAEWADRTQRGDVQPATFRVYEKIQEGIWTFRGRYQLDGYRQEYDGRRNVFRFLLRGVHEPDEQPVSQEMLLREAQSRQIPPAVKQSVYKRDRGQCVMCGSRTQLHYDHDLPFSKGGSSATKENVRLLCARHNLAKSDHIE
jgi:hypothetical protein